jgi:acyl-CoA hydrolase
MADYVEQNNLQSKMKYSLFVGASAGSETENRWAALDMINRRSPHQVGKDIAKGINSGRINFFDKHLSMFPSDLVYVRNLKAQNGNLLIAAPPFGFALISHRAIAAPTRQSADNLTLGLLHQGSIKHQP